MHLMKLVLLTKNHALHFYCFIYVQVLLSMQNLAETFVAKLFFYFMDNAGISFLGLQELVFIHFLAFVYSYFMYQRSLYFAVYTLVLATLAQQYVVYELCRFTISYRFLG